MDKIIIKGLRQNNLKNISFSIPKKKIVVFTGVSGSGKSSIVFDTIANESNRQMKETYPLTVRSRMPKFLKPECDSICNLSACVVIDQAQLGQNARSTVGTVSEIYSSLRLLFSRVGEPFAGGASFFSFNDPDGMCPTCFGVGKISDINLDAIIDKTKSLNEGAIMGSTIRVGSWYFRKYIESKAFDPDKKICDYTSDEMDKLLHGVTINSRKIAGVYDIYKRRYLTKDSSNALTNKYIKQTVCPLCGGKRLNRIALSCYINGYSIADFCEMELVDLYDELSKISNPKVNDLLNNIKASISRMIDIGLGYLNLSRPTSTLSGGEAKRIKLVRHLGSSLSDMLYIFDEPSTGMHPRDVHRMNNLLIELRNKGNSVLVVEHDEDVISIADEVIDIGPGAGSFGGKIVFQGSYEDLLKSNTKTGIALSNPLPQKNSEFKVQEVLKIRNATLNNLKGCNVDIPLNCICVITGVAGSGKSSLMKVFENMYSDKVIRIDQAPITAFSRSTPASYLGFFDEIRKEFSKHNNIDEGMFSFNSLGACPVCRGKGEITTELAFMDPIITTCDKCGGKRFSDEALSYKYMGKSILDVLNMTVIDAFEFFDNKKIKAKLKSMIEVGLSYITLGEPMNNLSGGERQRIKLALNLSKKGSIYILDEPTTGLHPSDIGKLMTLFNNLVKKNNSVIIIEHNLEVMKMADYIIDVGPDGGRFGGEIVFFGTLKQMMESSNTITAKCLKASILGKRFTKEELSSMICVNNNPKKSCDTSKRIIPIGRIEQKNDIYKIVLCKEYKEVLTSFNGINHLEVVFGTDGLNNNDAKAFSNTKEKTIFRSIVRISRIDYDNATIYIDYINAINGTPLIDIMPYAKNDIEKLEILKNFTPLWPKNYKEDECFNKDDVYLNDNDSKNITIEQFVESIESKKLNVSELVIVKNNKEIYSKCWNDYKKDDACHVMSLTKSIMSLLIGIAIDKKMINSVDDKVLDYFPYYKVKNGEKTIYDVTIKHLLTMRAPFKCNNDPWEKVSITDDWSLSSLDYLGGKKGLTNEFSYQTVCLHILSGILFNATKMAPIDFANKYLFNLLGIASRIPYIAKDALEHKDFFTSNNNRSPIWMCDPSLLPTAGYGLCISATDLAKIGILCLNDGMYNNTQIVSKAWLDEMIKPTIITNGIFKDMKYGYLWWIMNDYSFSAIGNRGNILYIDKKRKMVVALTASFSKTNKDLVDVVKEYVESNN